MFKSLLISSKLELLNIILVLSADIIRLDFTLIFLHESFMEIRKSKGTIIDSCGTPCFKALQVENVYRLGF